MLSLCPSCFETDVFRRSPFATPFALATAMATMMTRIVYGGVPDANGVYSMCTTGPFPVFGVVVGWTGSFIWDPVYPSSIKGVMARA